MRAGIVYEKENATAYILLMLFLTHYSQLHVLYHLPLWRRFLAVLDYACRAVHLGGQAAVPTHVTQQPSMPAQSVAPPGSVAFVWRRMF